jgi:hypothetical protein
MTRWRDSHAPLQPTEGEGLRTDPLDTPEEQGASLVRGCTRQASAMQKHHAGRVGCHRSEWSRRVARWLYAFGPRGPVRALEAHGLVGVADERYWGGLKLSDGWSRRHRPT